VSEFFTPAALHFALWAGIFGCSIAIGGTLASIVHFRAIHRRLRVLENLVFPRPYESKGNRL
jgi:hypothetical protein